MFSLTSPFWRFVENYWYAVPDPPPRKRTKPLEVLCVGPGRSGTESLQQALLQLGYDHTLHGWELIFEQPYRAQAWCHLARRKWLDTSSKTITAAEFDELIGHAVAITDSPASCFAEDLVKAYPDAKVVLNKRRDLDKWMQSMEKSVISVTQDWFFYLFHWFDSHMFWAYNVFIYYLWPAQLNFINSRENFGEAVRARGKVAYEAHCNMVRGMVPPERLLEWSTEDGWEPLCKFLGKDIPNEPFPHVNTNSKGWVEREKQMSTQLATPAIKKFLAIVVVSFGAAIGIGYKYYLQ